MNHNDPANKDQTYASASAVAGLAREVEALRKAVEPVTALSRQIDDLARVVRDLAASQAAGGPSAQGAPSWLDLPADPGAVRSVLEDLTGWMREVFLRYTDAAQHLPECWLWHPDVVEELLWLMYAWLAAYRDEKATVARAGDWHDRYRPGVVRRIKALAGNCSLENHQPRGNRHTSGPVVPLAEAMAPIAEWWATRRDEIPPEPDDDQLAAAAAAHRRPGGGRR
ncbi:hypothetical protein ABZ863_11725 [Saccharomonospora sp. NPDC046836]|uniref:hypothetical protein n=1 Tax=Saccharomonospora sp. NPDC046836 TaxID=3156921 RepID=UPI0033D1CDB7